MQNAKQNVGETGRKLKTRITEHLRNIRKHINSNIELHFNTTDHTIAHMTVSVTEKPHKTINYRKVKKNYFGLTNYKY